MSHYQAFKQKNSSDRLLGFTLMEIVIAISLSLVLLGALYAVYITSYKSYERSIARAELNQNARIAMERMTRDLRQTDDIVTTLPPTNTDVLNPAPSDIIFVDGHNTTKLQYVEYTLDSGNLLRKIKHYYFTSDPNTWVASNVKDQYNNPPQVSIDENVVKANEIQSLQFYGSDTININLVVSGSNNQFTYQTQTLGRNVQ